MKTQHLLSSKTLRAAMMLALTTLAACRGDNDPGVESQSGTFGDETDTSADSSPTTTATTSPTTTQPTSGDDSGADGSSGGITPVDCPGHRLYQCAGFKIGVYQHKPTEVFDWNPTGAGIDPV